MFNQLRCQVVVALTILVIVPQIARAQDRPAPAVDVAAGWVGFADDGIASETMTGAALRWYVNSRFAIGPEVIYIAGDNHSHLEGALTMGGGVRVAAGDRVTIGVDARIGWETHVRVNAVAGIRLF